MKTMETEAK